MSVEVHVSLLTKTTVTMRRRPRLAREDSKTDTYPVVAIFDVTIFRKYVYYSVDWLGYRASWERVERVQAIRFVRVYWRSALLGDYETRKNALLSSLYMHAHKIPIYDYEGAFYEESDDENSEVFDVKSTSYLREEFDPKKITDILDVAFSDEGSLMYKISGRYIVLQNEHKTVWIEYTPEIRPKVQYEFWTKALNSGAIRYFQLLYKLDDSTLSDALVKHARRSGFEFNDLTVKKIRGRPCDLSDFWSTNQSRLFDEVLTSNRADILSCILEKFCVKTKSGYLSTTQCADIASTFTLLQSKAADKSTTLHFVDYMEWSFLTFRHYNNIFYKCYEQYDVWFLKDYSIAVKEDEARKKAEAAKAQKTVPESSSDSEIDQPDQGPNKRVKKSSSRVTGSHPTANRRKRSTRTCRKLNYDENEDADDSSIDSTYDAREHYISDDSSENDSETDPWPYCYDFNPYPDMEHTCGMEKNPFDNLEPNYRVCKNKYCRRKRSRAECVRAIDELARNTTNAELLGGGPERVNKECSSRLSKYGLSIMRDLLHLTRMKDRHFCAPDLKTVLTATPVMNCDSFVKKLGELEKELNRATDYHERTLIIKRLRLEIKQKHKKGQKHQKKKLQSDPKAREITKKKRIRKKVRRKVLERYLSAKALMERCLKSGSYVHRKTMVRSRQNATEERSSSSSDESRSSSSDERRSSSVELPAQSHSSVFSDVPTRRDTERISTNTHSNISGISLDPVVSPEEPIRPAAAELRPLTADVGTYQEETTGLQVEPGPSIISTIPSESQLLIDVHSVDSHNTDRDTERITTNTHSNISGISLDPVVPPEEPIRPDAAELQPLTADVSTYQEETTCLQVEPGPSIISTIPSESQLLIDVHSDDRLCPTAANASLDATGVRCEVQQISHSCISSTPQYETLNPFPMPTEKWPLYLSISPSQVQETPSTDQMQLIVNDQNLENIYLQEAEENDEVIAWETLYKLIESVACTYPLAFVDTLTAVDEFEQNLNEELLHTLRSRSLPLENVQQTVEWTSSLLGKRRIDSSSDEESFRSKLFKLQGEEISTAVPLELLFTTEIDRHRNFVYIDSENQSYIVYVSIFHFLASNAFAQGPETIYQNCYRLLYPDFYGKPSISHPRKRRVLVRTSKFEFVEIWKNRYVEAHSFISKANLNNFADWNWSDARALEDEEGGYRISHKYEIGGATSEDRLLYAILQRQFPENVIYTTDQAFTLNYLSSTNFMRRFCHFILKIFNLSHFCVMKEIVTITDESILSNTHIDSPFTDVTFINTNRVNDLRAVGDVVRFYAEKYNHYSQSCYDGTPNQFQSYSCNRFSSPRDDSDQSNCLEPNQLVYDGQVASTSFSPMPVLRAVSPSVPSISSGSIMELGEAPQLEYTLNLSNENVAKRSTVLDESSMNQPQAITLGSNSHQSHASRIFVNTDKTPAEYDRLSNSSHDVEIIAGIPMQQSMPSTSNASHSLVGGIHQGLGDTFHLYSELSEGILEEPSYENYTPSYSTPYRYEVLPSTPPSPLLQQVSGVSSAQQSPTISRRIISNGTVKPFQLSQSSSLYCRPRVGEIIFEVAPYSQVLGKDVLECQKCIDQADLQCEVHMETVIKENDLSMLRIQFLSPEDPSTSTDTSATAPDTNETLLMIYREYERIARAQENVELSANEAIYDKRVFQLNITTATRKVKNETETSVYAELIEDELFRASVKIILTNEMVLTSAIQKSMKKLLNHIFTKDLVALFGDYHELSTFFLNSILRVYVANPLSTNFLVQFNDCERNRIKVRLQNKSRRRATSSRGSRTPFRNRSSTCSKPKVYTTSSFPRVSSMESVLKISTGYRGSPTSKALCRFRAAYSSKVSNKPQGSPIPGGKTSETKPARRRTISDAQMMTKPKSINRRRTCSEMEGSKSPIQSSLNNSAPSSKKINTGAKKNTMRSWKQLAPISRPAPTSQSLPYPLNFPRVYTSSFQTLAQSKSGWIRKSSKSKLAKRQCGFINIASDHIKPVPRYKPKLAIDTARAKNFLPRPQCPPVLPAGVADSSVSENAMLSMDQGQPSTSSGLKWVARSPTYEKPVSKALARLRAFYTCRGEYNPSLSPDSSTGLHSGTTWNSQSYVQSSSIDSGIFEDRNLTSSTTDMNIEPTVAPQNCEIYSIVKGHESTVEENGSRNTENLQPLHSSSNANEIITESESTFSGMNVAPTEGSSVASVINGALGNPRFNEISDELMTCEDGPRGALNDAHSGNYCRDEPIDVITIASTPERAENLSLFDDSHGAQIGSNDTNVEESPQATVLQQLINESNNARVDSPILHPFSVFGERHEENVFRNYPASINPNLVPHTDQQPGPSYIRPQYREAASMSVPAPGIFAEHAPDPQLAGMLLDYYRTNSEQPLIATSPTLMQNFVHAPSAVPPAQAFNPARYYNQLHNFRRSVTANPVVKSSAYSCGSLGNVRNFTGSSAPNMGLLSDYRGVQNPASIFARPPGSMSFETHNIAPVTGQMPIPVHVPVAQPVIPPTCNVTSLEEPISVTISHDESSSPTTGSPSSLAEIPDDAKPFIIFAPAEHIQGFCLLDFIASARERVKQSLTFRSSYSTSSNLANESSSSNIFREEFVGNHMSPAPTESSLESINYINLIVGPTILPMTQECQLNFQRELSFLDGTFKVVKPTCFSTTVVRKVLEDYLEDVPHDQNLLSAEVLSSTLPEYSSLMTAYGLTKMTLEALQAVKKFRFEDSPDSPDQVLANVLSNLMLFDRVPAKGLSKNIMQQSNSKNRREVITLHKFINGKILLETNLFELMPNGNSFTFTTFSLKLDNLSLSQSIFPRFYNITSLLRIDEQEVLFNFYRSKFLRFLQLYGNDSIDDTEPIVEIESALELEDIAKCLAADSRIHPTSVTFFLYDNSADDVDPAISTIDAVPPSSVPVSQNNTGTSMDIRNTPIHQFAVHQPQQHEIYQQHQHHQHNQIQQFSETYQPPQHQQAPKTQYPPERQQSSQRQPPQLQQPPEPPQPLESQQPPEPQQPSESQQTLSQEPQQTPQYQNPSKLQQTLERWGTPQQRQPPELLKTSQHPQHRQAKQNHHSLQQQLFPQQYQLLQHQQPSERKPTSEL